MTVNRTRVNRMKNYYIHHYTIYADTICKALNYIFKPNSNYRLGFKFFSPMKIFFWQKKLSVIYKIMELFFPVQFLKLAVFFEQFL